MPPRIELVERHIQLHDRLEPRRAKEASEASEQLASNIVKQQPQQQQLAADGDNKILTQHQNLDEPYQVSIVWRNVILMGSLHVAAIVGLYQAFFSAQWKTLALGYLLYVVGGIGITAGAHRLWAHRSYKAKLPLRFILAIFQTIALQNSIYEWSRDHRVHHKYSETDADPHNATRGFFFSHVGWLLCRKHPEVKSKGKLIDMGDLIADPIVRFQHRYYLFCVLLFWGAVPTLIPYLLWNETLFNSIYICVFLRYVITLNATWLVNSAAHMWGRRPYDKNINPSENRFVSLGAMGEGFHNYHHTFPWDYATSELGYDINLTKLFIDFFATIGWAYERKVVTPEMIKQRKLRTGDVAELGPYGPHN